MSDLSFSDLDDVSFDDLFDDNPFLDETHRHLTVDGTKVHFKTGLTTETRKLLLTTCSNLNFGRFSPTRGLVMENKFLSEENSAILYRRMGFDFMAKYLLFQHLVQTTSFGIDAWRVVLQCFGPKPGIVIDPVSETNPTKRRRFQGIDDGVVMDGRYAINSTKEVGDMLHGSLKMNLLTVGADRGPVLCDAQYPGHDLVQKARLKCCLELNDEARVDFCKQQLFPEDNIFEVVDCLNNIITMLEFEEMKLEEPPKKKVKLEITVSTAAPEETKEELVEETKVEIELLPEPVFTPEVRQRRRNAELEEDLDDGDAHYFGFARFGAYKKDWDERNIEKPIRTKSFVIVFFIAAFLVLLQWVITPYIPTFEHLPKEKGWFSMPGLYHFLAIVVAIFIAYNATFVRPTHRGDVQLFVITTALTFWVDTGSVVKTTMTPALYCYMSSKLILWYRRRNLAWVPFVLLLLFSWFTYETILGTCMDILKLFIMVTSICHEQRQGSPVGTILFAPYRDLLFVVEFPVVYIFNFLEELDLLT